MHTMSHFETVDVFSSSAEQLTVLSEQNKTKTTKLYEQVIKVNFTHLQFVIH